MVKTALNSNLKHKFVKFVNKKNWKKQLGGAGARVKKALKFLESFIFNELIRKRFLGKHFSN